MVTVITINLFFNICVFFFFLRQHSEYPSMECASRTGHSSDGALTYQLVQVIHLYLYPIHEFCTGL